MIDDVRTQSYRATPRFKPFAEFSRVRLLRDVTQHGQQQVREGVWEDYSETMPAGSRGVVVHHYYGNDVVYVVEFFHKGETIGVFTVEHNDLESVT